MCSDYLDHVQRLTSVVVSHKVLLFGTGRGTFSSTS